MRASPIPMSAVFSLVLALALSGLCDARRETCKQGENCYLPDCFCPTFTHPLGKENIPQIVYFGFDDAVQVTVSSYYDKLFTKDRINPNGCPISMTLYISDEYTDYGLANSYYQEGDEMGVHSVTHTDINTAAKLLKEATEQKMNIENLGDVRAKDIVGWRSPNLKTAGDDQPRILKQLNYTYDNSLSYTADLNYPFPFTLDYGYPYSCMIEPCPGARSKHAGFWEVMIHSLTDPVTGRPCGYVDGCRPETEDDALEYLWSNFLHTYENEKAPFGLNMHAAWFAFPGYLPAMERFIERLLTYPDVFIVSAEKMLSWMKDPTELSEINSFKPWGCTSRPVKRSNNGNVRPQPQYHTNIKHTTTTRQPTTTTTEATTTTTKSPAKDTPSAIHNIWNRFIPQNTQNTLNRGRPMKEQTSYCIQEKNCHLPKCFCRTKSPPLGISPRRLPQIVYLSISTPIDGNTFRSLTQLLWPPRTNSNGSPARGSVFIPVSGNYPPYVKQLTNMGARLGLRLEPNSQITSDEINQARRTLFAYYGVHSFGAGARLTGQVSKAFQGLNDTFDSFIVNEGNGYSWPNTLDFGTSPAECSPFTGGCSSEKYPGLWEVALAPMNNLPSSDLDTFRLLKYHFDRHYMADRSPFGININEDWLQGSNGQDRVRGLNTFIDFVIRRHDVRVLSIDQMLAWVGYSGRYIQA